MPDTSRAENDRFADDPISVAIERHRPQYERQRDHLSALLDRPGLARTLSDLEDPLEGCDLTVRSITFGRVGDPCGTHTRAQCKAVTSRLFGYEPAWPREWMGSREEARTDGEDEGREE